MSKDESSTSTNLPGFVYKFAFLHNFLTAGVASSITVSTMAPVERAKLILQVQNSLVRLPNWVPYKNFVDVIRRIVKDEGFFSLWRGNTASVIRCFPYQALNFAFKDKYHDIFLRSFEAPSRTLQMIASIGSGGIAAVTSLTIVYPLDFARTRMALDFGRHGEQVRSFRKTLQTFWRQDGIRGLYSGYPFSILGVFIYRSFYFGIYDTAKLYTPEEYQNIYTSFCQAELAATISGLISYPFDTVRRTMMMTDKNKTKTKIKLESFDCIRRIYQKGGVKGFYHGVGVNVVRGTGGALMFVLYDKLGEFFWGRPMYPQINSKNQKMEEPKGKIQRQSQDMTGKHSKNSEPKCRMSHGLCDF